MQTHSPRSIPLYQQIKTLTLQALEAGEWLAEEMLPSEFDLAGRFGVSQGTVRKALDDLVAQQVLYRRQGRGTFVASYPDEWGRAGFVSPDMTINRGLEPVVADLLSCARSNAGDEVCAALDLRRAAPVIAVKRLLRLNGRPMASEEIVVSAELFDGLDGLKIKQAGGALYELYHHRFGVRVVNTREQMRAVAANAEESRLLGISQHAPLLAITRIAQGFSEKPLEWRRTVCNTEAYAYSSRPSFAYAAMKKRA